MSHRIGFAALGCLLTLVSLGCAQQESGPKPVAEKHAAEESAAPAAGPKAVPDDVVQDSEVKAARAEAPARPANGEPMPQDPAPAQLPADEPLPLAGADAPQAMPAVMLTKALAERCKIKVGDQFPELKLPNAAGQEQTLAGLLSPKLTLVVFWNGKSRLALEQLSDMAQRFERRLRPHNVAIVSVNSGDQPQLAGELAQQRSVTFPVLCDVDGAAMAQVTGAGVPCCYLLDASGKVLWFDAEYSPTTRRDMVQAVRFALTH